ncbi:hypothetical protein GGI25_005913 [Coemansia spiralis]|uniref:Sel1 repeat family protein n=2 Tax=Coemansia TaxID=4863 RepID=A0A9W8G3N4_9FUNG|nr:hypothetical protein EDC05_005838 [Coemansia umbellata]KAJ2619322.1 hypothetical protein GGI26_005930 [Coemansia sp. RSA 1358]KAJ2670228.1 hypothetical protein GGI25_005913 [Coemansia spiralis]
MHLQSARRSIKTSTGPYKALYLAGGLSLRRATRNRHSAFAQQTVAAHVHSSTKVRNKNSSGSEIKTAALKKDSNALLTKIDLQRQPFTRFKITNSGISDIIPDLTKFEDIVSRSRLKILPLKLRELANQFVQINRLKSDINVRMEQWRSEVLDAFDNNLSDITYAASLFGKISSNKTLGCALYKVAAEEGYPNAAFYYAIIVGTGSIKIPNGSAVGWMIIKELVKMGHPASMVTLSDTKMRSSNPSDIKEGIRLLERAAEKDNRQACYKLGEIYRHGQGVPVDYNKAIEWHGKIKALGSSEGEFIIGDMLSKGQGTSDGKPDYAAAFKRFEQAAMKGSVESQFNLALYYLEGKGVVKDEDLGIEFLKLAADAKFPQAILTLSKLLIEGTATPKNYKKARALLDDATKYTDSAQVSANLAKILRQKLDNVEKQEKEKSWCNFM